MGDRRAFFKAFAGLSVKKKEERQHVYPPYFENIDDFQNCLDCEGVCVDACEEGIIEIIEKRPVLNFTTGGCTYCDECANICPKDVLSLEYKKNIQAKIEIGIINCMAWNKTICRSCADVCLDNAIKFTGLFNPEIDYDECTNCGFCVGVCPTQAITYGGVK
ncbi:4Fe-4S dicluster domain-containing protein [Nitrosophilus alvini]|uniref:4Fe-4S dicluster domain-containing protein n=1 Tax=Nitrosophilus alvini TaxID=2714855 RepID=UPI00190A9473|nr:4Fe-4S dicluster domain-containing protein [Nitrosophilus alvini]